VKESVKESVLSFALLSPAKGEKAKEKAKHEGKRYLVDPASSHMLVSK
jgi:hypothetical protein